MADSIDIIITDRVAATIAPKIREIGAQATAAEARLQALRLALSALDAPLNALRGELRATGAAMAAIHGSASKMKSALNGTASQHAAATAAANAQAKALQALQKAQDALKRLPAQTSPATPIPTSPAPLKAVNEAMTIGAGKALFFAAALASLGVAAVVLGDKFNQLQNKLAQVATGQQALEALTARVMQGANDARVSVEAYAGAFTRFNSAIRAAGGGTEEALQFTTTLSLALKASGATAQEASSAMLQLGQAMSSGVLNGEEFRSISENAPMVADAIAKAMGVSRSELKKLSGEGKITADVMRAAMNDLSGTVERMAASAIPTLGGAFAVLGNNLLMTAGQFEKATGLAAGLSSAIIAIAPYTTQIAIALAALGAAALVAFGPLLWSALATSTVGVALFNAVCAANPVGLVIIAVAGLVAILASLYRESQVSANGFATWGETISGSINFVVNSARNGIQLLGEFFAALRGEQSGDTKMPTLAGSIAEASAPRIRAALRDNTAAAKGDFSDHVSAVAATKAAGAAKLKAVDPVTKMRLELDKELDALKHVGSQWTVHNRVQALSVALAEKGVKVTKELTAEMTRRVTAIEAQKAATLELQDVEDARMRMRQLTARTPEDAIGAQVAAQKLDRDRSGVGMSDTSAQTRRNELLAEASVKADQLFQTMRAGYASELDGIRAVTQADRDRLEIAKALAELFKVRTLSPAEAESKAGELRALQAARAEATLTNAYEASGSALVDQMRMRALSNDALEVELAVKDQLGDAYRSEMRDNPARVAMLRALTAEQIELNKQTAIARDISADSAASRNRELQRRNDVLQGSDASPLRKGLGGAQSAVGQSRNRISEGTGSAADFGTSQLGAVMGEYKGFFAELDQMGSDFSGTLAKGIGDAFAESIVSGKSFGESLDALAKDAVGGLISSLVQVGVQWAANAALQAVIGQTATAASAASTAVSVAEAAIVATAWAPAAAAVSLASFGANSIAAIEGMTAASAVSKVLAGFQSGGYTGNAGVSEIAGVVHGREFVVNAAATAANRDALEAMNAGATLVGSQATQARQSSGASGAAPVSVKIENYGTSKGFEVEQLSSGDIRIIARDEARAAVQRDAPGVVASHIQNPNSGISRAIGSSTTAARRR